MNKEDLMKRIREENDGRDPVHTEAVQLGFTVSGICVFAIAFLAYLLEFFIFERDNIAVFLVAITSVFLPLTVYAVKTKRRFVICFSVWFGVMLLTVTVLYVIMLCRGVM